MKAIKNYQMNMKKNSLTGEAANDLIRQFVPIEDPIFNDTLGIWCAGGNYYRLWQRKDGVRAISWSFSHASQSEHFLAAAWDATEKIDGDPSTIIANHAKSYRELVISSAVLKKTRFSEEGLDTYYSPHQYYEVTFEGHQVSRITKSIFVGNKATGHFLHPRIVLWPDPSNPTYGTEAVMTRKDAELIVCKDFYASLKRVLTSPVHIDPELKLRHPTHFHAGRILWLLKKVKQRILPGLEKFDTSDGIYENLSRAADLMTKIRLHPIALLWKVTAAIIELRSLSAKESSKKWPGCLDAKDPIVQSLSDTSAYTYPLGGFFRPIKEGAFSPQDWLAQPVFGKIGTLKRIHRFHDFAHDGIHGLSESFFGPTIASTVRFYDGPAKVAGEEPNKQAIKIFRPDGSTVTLFKEESLYDEPCLWISYEPERHFGETESVISPSLMLQIRSGDITEIIRRSYGLKVRQLTFKAADEKFKKKFGQGFRSSQKPVPQRHAPSLPARTLG